MPQKRMARPRKAIDLTTYEGRFAARLKLLREKAGLTVQEVADCLEVIDRTVYHWETGYSFPKPGQLPRIVEALNLKSVRILFPEK